MKLLVFFIFFALICGSVFGSDNPPCKYGSNGYQPGSSDPKNSMGGTGSSHGGQNVLEPNPRNQLDREGLRLRLSRLGATGGSG